MWISIDQARTGMVVKGPIFDAQKRPLILAGAQLTSQYIQRLRGLGITRLEVHAMTDAEKAAEEAAEKPTRQEVARELDRAFSGVTDDPFMLALKTHVYEHIVQHRMRG